jgi:hypothetical protein
MNIYLGIWAKDRETLDSVLAQFGLLDHPDLELSGAGYAGWSGKIMRETAAKDENGQPIMEALPGVYVNAIAYDLPREQTGRKSLARNLRHRVVGKAELKIEQEAEGGRKPLLERIRLAETAGKPIVDKTGTKFDAKLPAKRIEITDAKGEVIFAAYSMEPDDGTAPATPACVWA